MEEAIRKLFNKWMAPGISYPGKRNPIVWKFGDNWHDRINWDLETKTKPMNPPDFSDAILTYQDGTACSACACFVDIYPLKP